MTITSAPISSLTLQQQAYIFALCSKYAYLDQEIGSHRFDELGLRSILIEQGEDQAYVLQSEFDVIVACRGTEGNLSDILTDINLLMVDFPHGGEVHHGFYDAVVNVWPGITAELAEARGKRAWFVGHSLGGAMATIAAVNAVKENITTSATIFTYGSPKCGDRDFTKLFAAAGIVHNRFVNNSDIVTRVPPLPYRHVGELVYMNHWGNVRNMTNYQITKDRLRGITKGLFEGKSDSLRDHGSDLYCKNLECWARGVEVEQTGL